MNPQWRVVMSDKYFYSDSGNSSYDVDVEGIVLLKNNESLVK